MKVKDLIETLSKLDENKEIHLLYDGCYNIDIDVEIVNEDMSYVKGNTMNIGDYVIKA